MEQRVAVVTGSTRGIGLAIARGLCQRGFVTPILGRDMARGQEVAASLGQPFVDLDVAGAADVERFVGWLQARYGGVDVLVNNAGIAMSGFDAQVAQRTLAVNFVGMMRLTDALLPLLRSHARVVMVSSGMGELSSLSAGLRAAFSDPGLSRGALQALADRFVADVAAGRHRAQGWPSSAYGVSKVAMNSYVRLLARELAADGRGIAVNAVCPGWVRTDMGGEDAPRSAEEGAHTPLWLATLPADGPSGGFYRDGRTIAW